VGNFRHFAMYRYLKKYVVTNSLLFWGKKKSSENERKKSQKNLPKVVTIAYNVKGCLRFFYFHILNTNKFG